MTCVILAAAATLTITGSIRLIYIAGYRRGMQRERERALRMGAALRALVPHRHDEYGHIVVSQRVEARN